VSLRENLWHEDVSQIELREPIMVSATTPLRSAIQLMQETGVGCVLVGEAGRAEGIFSERDLIRRVLAPRADMNRPMRDFMSSPVVVVRPSDSIGSAVRMMYEGGYRRLPVVNANGVAIGLVSVKRLIRYMADHFCSTVYNLPPSPRQVQQAREGA
jgi:CBS domain-containing protein